MLNNPDARKAPISHAMVLAAGLGTRMRPVTETCPKPLIEVANKALIDHTLDHLAEAAIEKAVVNMHYLADQLEQHLQARHAICPMPALTISDERACLLETGGGIAKALKEFGDTAFICTNTDSILHNTDGPYGVPFLKAAWQDDRMDALLLLCRPEDASGYEGDGDFLLDQHGRLSWPSSVGSDAGFNDETKTGINSKLGTPINTGINNRTNTKTNIETNAQFLAAAGGPVDGEGDERASDQGAGDRRAPLFIYTGFQILHPRLLKNASPIPHSIKKYWDSAMAAGRLYGVVHEGAWLHVGDPAGLAAAECFFRDHQFFEDQIYSQDPGGF